MKKFKIGDKVKVILASSVLPRGSVHVVTDVYWHWRHDIEYVYLNGDTRESESGWDIGRFELYKEEEKQVKIDMNKKYRRIGTHEPVRVICVDAAGPYNTVLLQKRGSTEFCIVTDSRGYLYGEQIIEEVPAVDWSKVKIDTPMWMRACVGSTWNKRHFNKFEGGRVHYWPNGVLHLLAMELLLLTQNRRRIVLWKNRNENARQMSTINA